MESIVTSLVLIEWVGTTCMVKGLGRLSVRIDPTYLHYTLVRDSWLRTTVCRSIRISQAGLWSFNSLNRLGIPTKQTKYLILVLVLVECSHQIKAIISDLCIHEYTSLPT